MSFIDTKQVCSNLAESVEAVTLKRVGSYSMIGGTVSRKYQDLCFTPRLMTVMVVFIPLLRFYVAAPL